MINRAVYNLRLGVQTIFGNTRLLFLAALLIVFPVLFLWVLQSFFWAANSNIESTQKTNIGSLHDSLVVALREDSTELITDMLRTLVLENESITKGRIVELTEGKYTVIASPDQSEVGRDEQIQGVLRNLSSAARDQTAIIEQKEDTSRVWVAFRSVPTEVGELFVITEHDLTQGDALILSRQRQAYVGFSAILFFLLLLAYWISSQTDWRRKYTTLHANLAERDRFTNMIAHEFRAPLTAIKGYASFLQESKELNKDEHTYADNIFTSAERLVSLVNDFLEVARIQAGKLSIKATHVAVDELVKSVVEQLQPVAKEHNLQLTAVQTQKRIYLDTDQDRLTQVLVNIISNALKYTEEGVVEVEVLQAAQEVTIKVKDSGNGMNLEDQHKLFEPFTRVGQADAGSETGTGLGLWITKQLVELLDGTIGVESIEGVGTHVVMRFRVK